MYKIAAFIEFDKNQFGDDVLKPKGLRNNQYSSAHQFETLLNALKNLTSTLENLQDWPGGSSVPNTIVPPMATATKSVIEEILNLVTDEKAPLLSSKSTVE